MLRDNPSFAAEACVGAPIVNSIVDSLLSIEYRCPCWATKRAVYEALAILDAKEDDE